jgi:ABC-type lipoprotein release transport system permease subunit
MTTITVGILACALLISFYTGMGEQRVNTSIEKELSHLQIHHALFKNDYSLKYPIKNGDSIANLIRANPKVQSASSRTVIQGMAATASGSTGISHRIIQGEYFSKEKKNQALISVRLAKKLRLKPGQKIVLTYSDSSDVLAASAFKVCGFFETNNGPYDDTHLFVNRTTINQTMELEDAVYEIAILLKSNEDLESVKQSLKSNFNNLKIETWKEIAPEVNYVNEVMDSMLYIFMSIIFLAIAFGIINTMHMSILERTKELGMLMALGMNNFRIFSMIILETIFLVIAGSPVGLLLSYFTVDYLHATGIDLSRFEKTMSSFGYDQVVYPTIGIHQYLMILIVVGVTALFSAVFPARRAIKIIPMKAIRK